MKAKMIWNQGVRSHSVAALMVASALLVATALLLQAEEAVQTGSQMPSWQRSLPSSPCPGSTEGTYCHRASPVLVDLTGDGKLEVIVATNRGHVLVYRHDGELLWDKDVAPAFGMGAGKQRIASSPAVADIDNDSQLEIVVGTGTVHRSVCTQGGVIALERDGAVKPGWPFLTEDYSIPPSGCRDTVFSTPALGDLDRDGDLEIVFGAFDMRLYALHHDARMVAGFPVSSNHFQRFGWENLKDRLADHIWSSPTLADLNGDGYLEMVVGTEEGNFDSTFSGVHDNWNCPFREVSFDGYCGGSIYAVDRFGQIVPGFPLYKLETTMSTPAILDIDEDGRSEFFVGTGDYYYLFSPDRPLYGQRLYGIDGDGRDLPGWEGGKRVGGVVTSSPALGDIDGDGEVEVVVPARDQRLYAFELDGNSVAGFPMTPKMHDGRVLNSYFTGNAPVLADYTGDGKMEIFLHHSSETIVVNGIGEHVTSSFEGDSRPYFKTDGPYWNSPAVGDLDGDGRLELVTQNSELTVWRLPNSSALTHWPMFKQNPARSGAPEAMVEYLPDSIRVVHQEGTTALYTRRITLNSLLGSFDWSLATSNPDNIKLPATSGTFAGQQDIEVTLHVPADFSSGERTIGTLLLTISRNGDVLEKAQIPVVARILRDIEQSYLPYTP